MKASLHTTKPYRKFPFTGQSPDAASFSGAEIAFPDIALGGIWEVEAQASNVPGTIFNTFTIHGDPWKTPLGWQDEQDLAVFSSTLFQKTQYRPAGIQMNNFNPRSVRTRIALRRCSGVTLLLNIAPCSLPTAQDRWFGQSLLSRPTPHRGSIK